MIDFKRIYDNLPVQLQNFAVSTKGFSLLKERYGGNFKKYCLELQKSQWYSKEKLKQIQKNKLKIIIKHAYENVPYYRNLFKKNKLLPEDIKEITDLEKIPILEKYTVKKYRDRFIATNIPKKKLIPHPTGGTTGTPLTIYTTKDSIQYNYAFMEERCKNWSGVKSGDKLATFLGKVIVPIQVQHPPFWRYNKAYNQMLFSSFHMNENNLEYYVKEFNSFRPEIVQGYVSTVYIFAKYILDYNLEVFSPASILLSSETLFDWQRKTIEKAFQAKIYNGYSLAEFVAFISECSEGTLHLSSEYGIVEYQKINGSDDKYELIATTLFNYAMPLIRYKTGDIVTLSAKRQCACGRNLPIIESIEGRRDNMLITPDNYYISSAAMSLIFKDIEDIEEAQIEQYDKNKIIVNVVPVNDLVELNLENLIVKLKNILSTKMQIEIKLKEKIERTAAGKFQFIISKVSQI